MVTLIILLIRGSYLYTDDNSGVNNNFKLTQYLKRGTTYYIKLYHKSAWNSGTIDLNIETHTDKMTNSLGGSWVNVGKRTYANSFVNKVVYLPKDLVNELYDNVSNDQYKKLRALVTEIGITAAVTYLTGKADAAILSKVKALGLPLKINISESGVSILTSILTMKVAPDILQMELDSIIEASNTFRNGVKISSMTIPYVGMDGTYTNQMINVYEPWDGIEMVGGSGQLGSFKIKDYETLWR